MRSCSDRLELGKVQDPMIAKKEDESMATLITPQTMTCPFSSQRMSYL
jgi:hypothetical protein